VLQSENGPLIGSTGPPGEATLDAPEWTLAMAEAAREIQVGHPTLDQTAESITAAALQLLPDVDMAAITVVGRDHTVTTLGATHPIPILLNQVQEQFRSGPCLSALWDDPMVYVEDVATDKRWREYADVARTEGVAAVLSVRLYVQHTALGALSLYSKRPEPFSPEEIIGVQAYAAHAAVALDQAREREQMRSAIDSRDRIGQAKGILMERYGLTDDQAFSLLVKTSQHTNTPLRLIVDQLTHTGELPGSPSRQQS
jgi:GAF domain-containing protein